MIASERQLTIREARKARWREIDIERAIRGSRFDVEGIREGIRLAALSLKIEVAHAIAREAMASALSESGVKDKSTHMIPRSRWKKLAELGLFDVRTFETLSQMKPQERDDWIADREVERLKALFGNDQQRRAARCRYDSRECQRLIRKHVGTGERFAPTRPNVPPSLAELAKRCTQKPTNKKAA
ncbi:hypothetical protein V5279_22520 [Bradyrhizobium sp. 26S5]|uniref:hypothetical protein n=1 Tax=Bradyrhizobium sp. 26S5 TaxID=3139729 RepID=UPI0030D29D19